MKKILLVCFFMVAIATQAQDNTDFKNETIEFIKLTGAGAAFENAIAQIGGMVSEELVAFYNTDLGKKLAEKQLGLTQKAMMFGQSWGMEVQTIAQKYN